MSNLSYKKPISISPGWNMKAVFHTEDGTNVSVSADIHNGIPPYTYKWSVEQDLYPNHIITSDTTSSYIILEPISPNGHYHESGSIEKLNSSLIKLEVADSNNNKKTFYYTYSSKCYPIILPNLNKEITDTFCGLSDTRTGSVVFPQINFLDSIESHITCNDLNFIACPSSSIENVTDLELKSATYRAARDSYIQGLEQNFILSNGIFQYDNFSNNILNHQGLLDSGSAAIVYKSSLRNINFLADPQPKQYSFQWNKALVSLGNKSINDIIGNTDINFIKLQYLSDLSSLAGTTGDYVYIQEDTSEYAWNPLTSTWDSDLAAAIANINTQQRARRNANTKVVLEFFLAFTPFLWGAYYFPLHRVKKEII